MTTNGLEGIIQPWSTLEQDYLLSARYSAELDGACQAPNPSLQ